MLHCREIKGKEIIEEGREGKTKMCVCDCERKREKKGVRRAGTEKETG